MSFSSEYHFRGDGISYVREGIVHKGFNLVGTEMDRTINGRFSPDIVLNPLSILDAPDSPVAEGVTGMVELLFGHVDIFQPSFQVPTWLHVVVLAHHLDALLTSHMIATDVLTGMV